MKKIFIIQFIVCIIFLAANLLPAQTIYFQEDFESGFSPYGFEGEHNNKGIMWNEETVETAGWNGSRGSRLIVYQGRDQDELGWGNFSVRRGFPETWAQGDSFFVRFRIYYETDNGWDGTGSQQNKMFIWGQGTYGGWNMRVMFHNEKSHPTSPCCATIPNNPDVGGFSLKRNIQEFCTGPDTVTWGRWYHIQFLVKSSSTADANDAEFYVWKNNNDYSNPNSRLVGGFNLAVSGIWDQGFTFGGFWSEANFNRDVTWIVDDFQIADFFDPNWYVSGSGSTAPLSPSNLRITR